MMNSLQLFFLANIGDPPPYLSTTVGANVNEVEIEWYWSSTGLLVQKSRYHHTICHGQWRFLAASKDGVSIEPHGWTDGQAKNSNRNFIYWFLNYCNIFHTKLEFQNRYLMSFIIVFDITITMKKEDDKIRDWWDLNSREKTKIGEKRRSSGIGSKNQPIIIKKQNI